MPQPRRQMEKAMSVANISNRVLLRQLDALQGSGSQAAGSTPADRRGERGLPPGPAEVRSLAAWCRRPEVRFPATVQAE